MAVLLAKPMLLNINLRSDASQSSTKSAKLAGVMEQKLIPQTDSISKLSPSQVGVLLIVSAIPSIVKILFYPDYPGADDSFMHLSVIQNLSHGMGWGINANEPVNLSTSPAFTFIFYLVSLISDSVLLSEMMISMIITTISLFALYFIAYRITREFWMSLLCVFLSATNVLLWRWNGTFIESSLAFCFVIWAIYFYFFVIEEGEAAAADWYWKYFLFGLLLGFGVLLRPELGILGCVFFVNDFLISRLRIVYRYLFCGVGFALVIGCYAAWSLSYFGTVVPSTFYAKTGSQSIGLNLSTSQGIGLVVLSGALGTVLAIGVMMFLPPRRGAPSLTKALRSSFIFWAIPLGGFLFYYLKTTGLQSPARYYLPFMATLPLVPLGLARDRIAWRTMLAVVGLAGLCQLACAAYLNYTVVAPVLVRQWSDYESTMFEAADVLNRTCEKGQTVYVWSDIGSFSYRLNKRCHIADHDALATPELLGLSFVKALAVTKASFVVESLGTPERQIEHQLSDAGIPATLIWSRSFRSLGTWHAGITYETRIYQLGNKAIGDQRSSSPGETTLGSKAPFVTTPEYDKSNGGVAALFPWATSVRSH